MLPLLSPPPSSPFCPSVLFGSERSREEEQARRVKGKGNKLLLQLFSSPQNLARAMRTKEEEEESLSPQFQGRVETACQEQIHPFLPSFLCFSFPPSIGKLGGSRSLASVLLLSLLLSISVCHSSSVRFHSPLCIGGTGRRRGRTGSTTVDCGRMGPPQKAGEKRHQRGKEGREGIVRRTKEEAKRGKGEKN